MKRTVIQNSELKISVEKVFYNENSKKHALDIELETVTGVKCSFWLDNSDDLPTFIDMLKSYQDMSKHD